MKVCEVVSSIDVKMGGLSKSVSELCTSIANPEMQVGLFSSYTDNPYLNNGHNHNLALHLIPKSSSFKNTLHNELKANSFDLMHGHGIWQPAVHYMAELGRDAGVPYIISPRGMLKPWCLGVKKLKKKIALHLYQNNDLNKAACIHASSASEADSIRSLGFRNPIAVIPNGVDINEFNSGPKTPDIKRKILFLSRIHPQKGIEILIEAWQEVSEELKQNWKIEIAGFGEEEYISSLKKLIKKLKLENEIEIADPKYGSEKLKLFRSAELFVLPSYSESFGNAIVEALACGIPVITTKGTPWEELNTQKAGWWIDTGVEPLAKTLAEALQLSSDKLVIMGKNGRRLVEEKCSLGSAAEKMTHLYKWILGKELKPDFVYDQ